VLVYAGAIMVLFLFVIMLLNLEREPAPPPAAWRLLMLCVGGVLGLELAWFFLRRAPLPAVHGTIDKSYGSAVALSRTLFTDYLFPFEVTSVLLLAAMVGVLLLARRREG